MSTRYLWIRDVAPPAEIGTDEHDRVMFSLNLEAYAAGAADNWPAAIVTLLTTAGLATLGTNCWIGSAATAPAGAGPLIHVLERSGGPTTLAQDGGTYENLGCQVVVRAAEYAVAQARAFAAWRALRAVTNTTIT